MAPNTDRDSETETETGCGEGRHRGQGRHQGQKGGNGVHTRAAGDGEGSGNPRHKAGGKNCRGNAGRTDGDCQGTGDGGGPGDRGKHDGEGPHRRGEPDGKGRSGSGNCDGDRRRRGRKRDACGRFADSVTGEDVLGVFEAVDGPVVTSTDVGDVLGISTESARQHLNELVAEGPLRRRKTGRTVVYWTVETTDSD